MKILYFFRELAGPMSQWQRTHFIDELNRHGCEIDCFNPLAYNTPEESNERLLAIVKKERYDLFFTNVCSEKELFIDTLLEIKRIGVPTVSLRCDNLVIPFSDKKLAPYFDLVWLTSKETQCLYDKWGVKSVFLPYAANPFTFNYTAPSSLNKAACFVGTPYGSRAVMINALTSGGIPIDVYYKKDAANVTETKQGPTVVRKTETTSKWDALSHRVLFPEGRKLLMGVVKNKIVGQVVLKRSEFFRGHPVVNPDEQSRIYSDHVLALASTSANHTDILRHPLRIINLRNFEIPMSGGIEICRYNRELAEYFEDGKEIVFYKSNEELIDKARFYTQIAKESDLLSIKSSARLRAENEHTWWNRFSIVFDILNVTCN